ncbi:UNVERIFIED_CONTAM: hypothetical protein O8I53_11130 [Campylobacter lari]
MNNKNMMLYNADGILQIVIPTSSFNTMQQIIKKAQKTISFLNKNKNINPYFDEIALLSFNQIKSRESFDDQMLKTKYLLFNAQKNRFEGKFNK